MKIRAITLGCDLSFPGPDTVLWDRVGAFFQVARQAFADADLEVQTCRIAGPELPEGMAGLGYQELSDWASGLAERAAAHHVEYVSLGRAPASNPELLKHMLPVLRSSQSLFLSADLIASGQVSIPMARACAATVIQLARGTEQGLGNLRFAATASCPPEIPFFPAAYHSRGKPRFSLAVQAADVVESVLAEEGEPADLEDHVVAALEGLMQPVERLGQDLAQQTGCPFVGIDLSPAPFPEAGASIGAALEKAGADYVGAPGTLYLAALITRAIRRTRLQRTGFSGLMLPLLEDAVLARGTGEHPLSLHELLLYSAVCGTGLDTVPLPGNVTEVELASMFLDVAALSLALGGKPLTARLLPIPGARAGDPTHFDFGYFANGRVMPVTGAGAARLLERAR